MNTKLTKIKISIIAVFAFMLGISSAFAQQGGGGKNRDSVQYGDLSSNLTMKVYVNEDFNYDIFSYFKNIFNKINNLNIQQGNSFIYQASFITNDKYIAPTAQTIMSISNDGVLSFKESRRVPYNIIVKAKLQSDTTKSVSISVYINVADRPNVICATIRGKVNFTVPMPYDYFYNVEAYSKDGKILRTMENNHNMDGYFLINVKPGEYYVGITFYKYSGYNDKIKSNTIYFPGTTVKTNAQLIDAQCDTTVFANFTINEQDLPEEVTITRDSITNRRINLAENEVFTYQINAASTKNSPLEYKVAYLRNARDTSYHLSVSPQGLVTFYSSRTGSTEAQILARSTADSNAYDYLDLAFRVTKTNNPEDTVKCAYITGNVKIQKKSTDNYEKNSIVMVDAVPIDALEDPCESKYEPKYYVMADDSGNYSINVPKGDYYVVFYSRMSDSYFYKNGNIDSAEIVTVNCGDTRILDSIKLKNRCYDHDTTTEEHSYCVATLKGRVYDKETNQPVRAKIKLIYVGSDNTGDDTGEEGDNDFALTTGPNGYYDISFMWDMNDTTLPKDFPVKLLAVPFNKGKSPNNIKYEPQYYKEVSTIDEAITVNISPSALSDTSKRYDFPLVRKASEVTYKHKIKGNVTDAAGSRVVSLVTLIRKPDANQSANQFEFKNVPTDTIGNYLFESVKPGKYMLFSIPISKPLMPGFFVQNDFAALKWEDATEIVIPNDTVTLPEANYTIKLRDFTGNTGGGIIRGKIATNHQGGIIKTEGGINDGLGSVLLSILDSKGRTVRYTYTDDMGSFNFKDLAYGDYTMIATKYGYSSKDIKISINKDKKEDNSILYMEAAQSGVNDNNSKELSVYPNPAKGMVNINFNAELGNAALAISDMSGNTIYSADIQTVSGANSVQFDTKALPNGLYLIKIQNGKGSAVSTMMTVVK